jgi:Zn-dependent protease with chaperone function
MATDFFERQSTARRNTKWLIWTFSLAVLGILVTTFVATTMAVEASKEVRDAVGTGQAFPWQVPGMATVAALGLIAGGSLFKIAQLAGGGTAVAERLGGRRLYPNSLEPNERRLLNVVEEMALASGVPVPPVFLMKNEEGINAFAAGFSPSDAVIGVTHGCVEQLSRDELQGVIAHEFSHILNGDMRLNLRMIGVLHGILVLGLVGRELLRITSYSGGRRRNDGAMYLLLIGLAMMVLGFLGTFLGNLIKAAISRQREYLADASAVQFTRNPEGISGALKKIGGAVFGSKLKNPRAGEASHMYFAEGLSGMFATHPPLAERIRILDPRWDGKYPKQLAGARVAALADGGAAALVGVEPSLFRKNVPLDVVLHAADQVAQPTEVHRHYAAELVASMPAVVVDAAHDPYGARAVIYASLLDVDPSIRGVQLEMLQQMAEPDAYQLTLKLIPEVDELEVRAYLPLVDMALPALRALSPAQYQQFSRCFVKLVQADKRLGLFEWTLHQILLRHLRPQFERIKPPHVVYYGLQKLGGTVSVLLSTLARASQCDSQFAFESGAKELPEVPTTFLPASQCGLNDLQKALEQLAQVTPKLRGRLIDAAAATICADSEVHVEEAELLRGICDMLDCPMPPLLPGQKVAARQAVS